MDGHLTCQVTFGQTCFFLTLGWQRGVGGEREEAGVTLPMDWQKRFIAFLPFSPGFMEQPRSSGLALTSPARQRFLLMRNQVLSWYWRNLFSFRPSFLTQVWTNLEQTQARRGPHPCDTSFLFTSQQKLFPGKPVSSCAQGAQTNCPLISNLAFSYCCVCSFSPIFALRETGSRFSP